MATSTQNSLSISLIIPCYNDADALDRLLSQAVTQEFNDIIVVDGGSYDGSQKRARQHARVTLLSSKKGRGQQIATGVAQATSDVVWVLHADSTIPNNALREIETIIDDLTVALGCFPLQFDESSFFLRLFAWLSRFDSVFTTFGDQGYFCRRQDYAEFGNGANYPLLEDVAFRRFLLKKSKGKVRKSKEKLTTSARRFQKTSPLKTQVLNARILTRYFLGASPIDLYNEYYDDPLDEILNDPTLSSSYSDLGNNKT